MTVPVMKREGSKVLSCWMDQAEMRPMMMGCCPPCTSTVGRVRRDDRANSRVTLRASLFGTFLQTLPDLVTPLKGYSLSSRSCPPTRSAPSERFRYEYDCRSSLAPKHARKHEAHPPRVKKEKEKTEFAYAIINHWNTPRTPLFGTFRGWMS